MRTVRFRRFLFLAAGIALWSTLGVTQAQAQIGSYARPQVNNRPAVSPYLNLGRPGSAAINYYGLVRPQIQTQQALQTLQQEITDSQSMNTFGAPQQGIPNDQLPITGHQATFQYTSHYFPPPGGRFSAGSGRGGAVATNRSLNNINHASGLTGFIVR